MAQIYNLLFEAPTALTLKTTLHSHHIGAAALGQTDRGTAVQSAPITPPQTPPGVHSQA